MSVDVGLLVRRTKFTLPGEVDRPQLPIQELFHALVNNEDRNALIFVDILHALASSALRQARRGPARRRERKAAA